VLIKESKIYSSSSSSSSRFV